MRSGTNLLSEYPCPECGYDGPHFYLESNSDSEDVYECGDSACGVEFTVDWSKS